MAGRDGSAEHFVYYAAFARNFVCDLSLFFKYEKGLESKKGYSYGV